MSRKLKAVLVSVPLYFLFCTGVLYWCPPEERVFTGCGLLWVGMLLMVLLTKNRNDDGTHGGY